MKKKFIEQEIEALIQTGSSKEELQVLKEKLINSEFLKDRSLDELVSSFINELSIETNNFMETKKDGNIPIINGISSTIYLPDYENQSLIKASFIDGKIKSGKNINVNTLFDVASITKLFTLVLLFKLEELGYIDLNRPVSLDNEDFSGLKDFTYNDLIKLNGELYTNGNITSALTKEEANTYLKTLYLKSDDRTTNKYTDFGAIAMSKTIEKVMSKAFCKSISFDEIMDMFILKPFGLRNACFNPTTTNITGNGNNGNMVHDPKARILGGNVGSAGLFISSDELAKFARELFKVNFVKSNNYLNLISKPNLDLLGQITYPNGSQPQKGNLGIYVKHPLGLDKTWVPGLYSNGSFAHQGWTGPVAIFDPNNLIHNNILVDAIMDDVDSVHKKNDKVIGYMDVMQDYISKMALCSMELLFSKKYFDNYENTYQKRI